MRHAVIDNQVSGIENLTGFNYKKWKRDIEFTLGLMDIDIAILEPKPATPEEGSSATVISKFEKWERANRLSLMLIKRFMSDTIRDNIHDQGNAKDFMSAIGAKFKESDKAETTNLMSNFTNLKYETIGDS